MTGLKMILDRIARAAKGQNYEVSTLASPRMLMVKVPITQWAKGINLLVKEAQNQNLIPTAIAFEMIIDEYPEAEVEITFCGEH
jgi:hypothetical protein